MDEEELFGNNPEELQVESQDEEEPLCVLIEHRRSKRIECKVRRLLKKHTSMQKLALENVP